MNEPHFANRIRHLLNQGAPLGAPAAERLRVARERALERRKLESAAGAALAGNAGGSLGIGGRSLRVFALVLALAVAFAATYTWHQKQRAAEVEELDALVLSSELPIDAYLDQGFQAWLKRRAAQ
jgi:hypothetical protein